MKSHSLPVSGAEQDIVNGDEFEQRPTHPPFNNGMSGQMLSSFWRNRLFETGLIISMALYYIVGNQNLGKGPLFHVNPLFSLPFLLLFALLCWLRLPFALALLPLGLPYYLLQKTVFSHYAFSVAEISLGVCVLVALGQLLLQRRSWPYWLSWRDLWQRAGPMLVPALVFLAAATFSVVIAYNRYIALLAWRKEVLAPLVYALLALCCLRSRSDIRRLLSAFLACGVIVALVAIIQYHFFKNTLVVASGVRRVSAMYGSANSIGLLFDYILPLGLALLAAMTLSNNTASWARRLLMAALCLLLLYVLYLSQSLGAWLAISVAALFIGACSLRSRKALLIGAVAFVAGGGLVLLFFHMRIQSLLFNTHIDVNHVSTLTKRLYLWRSALNMIHDSPWTGYGMDNWLCHYSTNKICYTPHLHHYLIARDPVTHISTDLKFEPDLSHPHDVFLHVWVSTGISGLLAFIAVLVLFFWLFTRILRHLRASETPGNLPLQWMTLGVGAAMLAAMVQGLGDSAFLEQDLAFCFWMLVVAMLVLRQLSQTTWRGKTLQEGPTRTNVV